jgi:transposase
MLQLSPTARVFVANEPVSFVKGMYGLSAVCRNVLGHDPHSGAYFVFRNRGGDSVRILMFDGDGLWLSTKKFASGRIKGWPSGDGPVSQVGVRDLLVMLWHGNPMAAGFPGFWKKIA